MKNKFKNYVKEKGIKIYVIGEDLILCKDDDKVAEVVMFTSKYAHTATDDGIGIRFDYSWGMLKGFNGMGIKTSTFNKLVEIKEEIKAGIDTFFKELDNVEIYSLDSRFYLSEEPEIQKLNKFYFQEALNSWIKENKQHFTEARTESKAYESTKYIYTFAKADKVEKSETVVTKEELEKRKEYAERYDKMEKMAETMSDEEFEDHTGLTKEYALN